MMNRFRWIANCSSLIALYLLPGTFAAAQENPHKNLDMNCETCHVEVSWNRIRFDHSTTKFELLDRHREVDCKSCHDIQNFSKTSSACLSCHEDVHRAKMGSDCERCHAFQGWEIFDVEEIHANTQFPLLGSHVLVDCQSCHQTRQQGDFAQLTTNCISCHQQRYLDTETPNHVANSFSTDCQSCHDMNDWRPAFLANHDAFFPVFSGEHDGAWEDCAVCHTNPTTFTEFTCLTCHEHRQSKMDEKHGGIPGYAYESTSCLSCHPTGEEGEFKEHDDRFFPIFSGKHAGEWDECLTCHPNPSNQKEFTCLECHEHRQSKMDEKHRNIPGYAYESTDCLGCHPSGKEEDFKDHDNLFFPIFAGRHAGQWEDCITCHLNPSNRVEFTCIACHEHDKSEMDVHHRGISGYLYVSRDCYTCHPDGEKGEFREHDNLFFPIFSGKHTGEWDDCLTCHENPDNRKEFTCLDCHEHGQSEMDAKHAGISGYAYQSNECYLCHPTGDKGEFRDHDNLFFPIFAGKHLGAWDDCFTCHENPDNRKEFTCLDCHEHGQSEMDAKHAGIAGYAYQSNECYLCHPTGEKGEFRDHDNLFFPIFTGKHLGAWDDCFSCHQNPDNRKEFTCLDCHEHGQSEMDTKHTGIAGYTYQSNECYLCHPTGERGEFRDHDNLFFPIFTGKHASAWDDCFSCHPNPSNRKDFTCLECHEHRRSEMDAIHQGIPGYAYQDSECLLCHPTGEKGEFQDHDALFFPIFSGPHNHKWDSCTTCHENASNRQEFTCLNCHVHDQQKMDDKHLGEVDGYAYESNACYDCHPNGKEDDSK